MNEFKLNKPQLQAALNNLVEEKSGLNTLMTKFLGKEFEQL